MRGREPKRYPYQRVQTPYEKLKSLPHASRYLKPGVSFEQLDASAAAMSDNDAAQRMQKARERLFFKIAQKQTKQG